MLLLNGPLLLFHRYGLLLTFLGDKKTHVTMLWYVLLVCHSECERVVTVKSSVFECKLVTPPMSRQMIPLFVQYFI